MQQERGDVLLDLVGPREARPLGVLHGVAQDDPRDGPEPEAVDAADVV